MLLVAKFKNDCVKKICWHYFSLTLGTVGTGINGSGIVGDGGGIFTDEHSLIAQYCQKNVYQWKYLASSKIWPMIFAPKFKYIFGHSFSLTVICNNIIFFFTDFRYSWYWHQWQWHCWWRWGYFHRWTFFDSTILPKVTQWRPHLRRARFTSYLDGRDRRRTAPWTRTDDSRTGNRKCNITGTLGWP